VRNSVAHSGCGRIEVSVDFDDAELRERVEEEGKGFDPHGGESVWHDETAGMANLPRGWSSGQRGSGRKHSLGGLLDVTSEPGRASAVEVRILLAD
jgi:signal transduction histidine kinase